MITYSTFKSRINESLGFLERKTIRGHHVVISKDFEVMIDGSCVAKCYSLDECIRRANSYVDNVELISEVNTQLPSERLIDLISHYHQNIKITNTIVEHYNQLNEQMAFSLDPVLLEMKVPSSNFSDKVEFTLKDGSKIAITEDTLKNLNSVIKDKYQIVEYMRSSRDNFMHVIRKLS